MPVGLGGGRTITLAVKKRVVVAGVSTTRTAILQADHGIAVRIFVKQIGACRIVIARWARDLQLVGTFVARILTGEATIAAPILLDAGRGFIAGLKFFNT